MQDEQSRFNYAVSLVLKHEGGLYDDDGEWTNFGLTAPFLISLDIHVQYSKYDSYIKSLTKPEAEIIYYKYWQKFHYNLLETIEIATKVFDMSVNMGNHEAHLLLQRAINTMSHDKLLEDGILGVKTMWAANNLPPSYLHQELREISEKFYRDLVEKNTEKEKYLGGWLTRAAW